MVQAIHYRKPADWMFYDIQKIAHSLIGAKSALRTLQNLPYQKSWLENLQKIGHKEEVFGTTRIEGVEVTEQEFQEALEKPFEFLKLKNQREIKAADNAYKWISKLQVGAPITKELLMNIHRQITRGIEDSEYKPGRIRESDDNVIYGTPIHRGANGGDECQEMINELVVQIESEYNKHDPLVGAIAAHYHLASIHPFSNGNGRTARALEAFMLRKAGLPEGCLIPMSNYYYDERGRYFGLLSNIIENNHDLTEFMIFALEGLEIQINRALEKAKDELARALYRNLMFDFYNKLESKKRRVITLRQLEILKYLLSKKKPVELDDIFKIVFHEHYQHLKIPYTAFIRDISKMSQIEAIEIKRDKESDEYYIRINLDWPQKFTETELYKTYKSLPAAKSSIAITPRED